MHELKLALAGQVVEQRSLAQWLKSWQVGQVLQARVLDASATGRLLLGVAGHQLVASTESTVPKGTALTLQVSGLTPVPSLKVLNLPVYGPAPQNLVNQQMQILLPRQNSVTAPLTTLLDPAQKVNILSLLGVKSQLLERLQSSLAQLGLPVNLKSLQKRVVQSGFFLEADLLQQLNSGRALPEGDIKSLLMRILQQINQAGARAAGPGAPPVEQALLQTLRTQVEGALAAITLNQLTAAQAQERPGGLWLFDMPFRVQDTLRDLRLTIERREPSPDDKRSADNESGDSAVQQREWRVFIRVSLPQLGPLEAEMFLRGTRVSLVLYAQLVATVGRLESRLPMLRDAIEHCQLEVSVLRCQLGARSGGSDISESDPRWRPCVDVTI